MHVELARLSQGSTCAGSSSSDGEAALPKVVSVAPEPVIHMAQPTTSQESPAAMTDRRPSVVSLAPAARDTSAGRPPSPVSAAYGLASARHPADTQAAEASDHADEGEEANALEPLEPPPPSFLQSQARHQRTQSTPPSPVQSTHSGMRRSASQVSHASGVFLSVANSSLARLSPNPAQLSPNQNRRSFFANLLRRSPDPSSNSNSPSMTTNGFVSHHQPLSRSSSSARQPPSTTADIFDGSSSSPALNGAMPVASANQSSFEAGVGLGVDLGGGQSQAASSSTTFSQMRVHTTTSARKPAISLQDLGLQQKPISAQMSLTRHGQPICGLILDERYLLIGTTSGLDFMPLDADHLHIKKPVSLIKRTRFKQLAVLKERSNVLLAVAGRNDHVRVYALDGIRSIIERKMKELNTPSLARALVNAASGHKSTSGAPSTPSAAREKGKSRARPPPMNLQPPQSMGSAVQPGPITPPPPYMGRRSSAHHAASTPSTPRSRNASTVRSRTSVASLRASNPPLPPQELLQRRRSSAATVMPLSNGKARKPSIAAAETASKSSLEDAEDGVASTAETSDSDWDQLTEDLAVGTSSSSQTAAPRLMARSASVQRSNSAELTRFLRDVAPPGEQSTERSPPQAPRARPVSTLIARSASREVDSSFSDLASFLKETGPSQSAGSSSAPVSGLPNSTTNDSLASVLSNSSVTTTMIRSNSTNLNAAPRSPNPNRLSPRPASMAVTGSQAMRELANFFRDEAPGQLNMTRSGSTASSASWHTTANSPNPQSDRPQSRLSTTSEEASSATHLLPGSSSSPNLASRQRRRWSDMLRSSTAQSPLLPQTASSPALHEQSEPPTVVEEPAPEEAPAASFSQVEAPRRPSSIRKLRATEPEDDNNESENASGVPVVDPGSVSLPAQKAEQHPASANAPLEYVKLARTKGTRFIKCIETRKRTYLAVLCGDAGERIELFTGSKSVSLSLNRTFVLPESPRTIEFQLQGDDLVDVYLVYDESIFALEPATVRVREVGVTRHERRAARRERERERAARQGSSVAPQDAPQPATSTNANDSSTETDAEVASLSSPHAAAEALPSTSEAAQVVETPAPDSTAASAPSDLPAFTTFQQLMYIPNVPASVLAPAYVIPPTYDSVISSSPMPEQGPRFLNPFSTEQQPSDPSLPLLSPISLLANHPARSSNGPPGLFYVSRGKHSTNIVDGDGRSVIKRPIQWKDDTSELLESGTDPEMLRALHVYQRIEILLAPRGRAIMVGIGTTEIQAVELGSQESDPSVLVIPEAVLKRKVKPVDSWDTLRDVVFLGSAGSRLFWSERVGNQAQVHSLQPLAA